MGASTIKWTAPDPCLVFNESDSKLYTNFEFYEKTNYGHSKKKIYNAKQNYQEKIQGKYTYLEEGASGVLAGDIEQVIKLHKIDDYPQSFVMMLSSRVWIQGIWKKIPILK